MSAIRDLCATARDEQRREKLLIEFKTALVSAANEEQIPYGPQRSEVISRLVTVFIDEFYKVDGDGESRPKSATRV